MNRFFTLFLFLLGSCVYADNEFVVQPRSYWFSTHYDFYSGDEYLTTIEKDWFKLNTVWSVCDDQGEFSNGVARLFSLGSLLNSKREIDLYNEHHRAVGYIQGEFFTTASGKFVFYNEYNKPYAVAFLDQNKSSVNIVDFHNQRIPIAVFRRTYVPGGDYFWNVKVVKEGVIEQNTLYVFSAFITDSCWPMQAQNGGSSLWDSINTLILVDHLEDEN